MILLAALSAAAAGQVPGEQERRWKDLREQRQRYMDSAPRPAAAALDRFTVPTLTRFRNEVEFDAYLRALRAADREDRDISNEARRRFALARPLRFAQAKAGAAPVATDAAPQPVCDPAVQTCPAPAMGRDIFVTGSRISTRNASITNNQMRGVDEGDIVKQIGRHLLVLSDGRIFVIDTRPGGRAGLALVDRLDVYRDPNADTWYDEMLVFEDRILVAGYSYDSGETELSVLRLGADGRLAREGVFMRRSNDYYSSSNYATRLIGDSLLLYSIFNIDEIDRSDDSGEAFGLSSMQRWTREPADRPLRPRRGRSSDEDEARTPMPPGPGMLDADAIYRPVRTEREPSIHAISICPLGAVLPGAPELPCRSTAFVGPEVAEWYVTADETILWGFNWDDRDGDCPGPRPALERVLPALLYRIPHDGSAPGVAGARGKPFDQFSMQANGGRLRALVDRQALCARDIDHVEPMYVETPLSVFGPTLRELGSDAYAEMPDTGTRWIANRFTENHLVYGGLSQYRRGLPNIDWDEFADDDEAEAREWRRRLLSRPPAYVVPAGRPADVSRLDIGHTVIRAERYGENDVVLTGYRSRRGLSMTLIDLDARPRIGSTIELEGRFESEGRSHAFNSLVELDGTGMIGLPTTPDRSDADRRPARSHASDVSFLSVGRDHALVELGELTSNLLYARSTYNEQTGEEANQDGLDGYECLVSCIDWYGNSRPIFTDGRIFALTGGELIEGRRFDDRMIEVRRIDFLRARVPRR